MMCLLSCFAPSRETHLSHSSYAFHRWNRIIAPLPEVVVSWINQTNLLTISRFPVQLLHLIAIIALTAVTVINAQPQASRKRRVAPDPQAVSAPNRAAK